jgi:hypothetical protein
MRIGEENGSYRNKMEICGCLGQRPVHTHTHTHTGKSKVPVLFLPEHHAMKAYWGVEV